MNKLQDICEVTCIHKDKVLRVRKDLETSNTDQISDLFKILADQTRITIVHALALEEELCVCDVCAIVGCSKATASHHLRLLKNVGVAHSRKDGRFVYYSLDDDYVRQFVQLAFKHQTLKKTKENEPIA